MSLIDISTNSPNYFYWKSIGMVNENLNFDIKVERVKEARKFVWPYFLFVSYESRRGSWP